MSWYRAAFGRHYPILYRHRDLAEARRCVENLPYLAPLGDGPYLDLGCGEGRHLPFLREIGGWPVGLDLSADLLARARERDLDGRTASLVQADMRVLPFLDQSFTSVVSLFTAFGYFGGIDEHAPLLGEIARVLREGGHWFLDFLNCRAVRQELEGGPLLRERSLEPLLVAEERRLGENPLRIVKTVRLLPLPGHEEAAAAIGITAAGLHYQEEVALFELRELDALARSAGLVRAAAAGGYENQPFDADQADRWLLVFRKEESDQQGDSDLKPRGEK